ncbi:MAG: radical SAM protein [Candidatus Hydrogenedentes bacterium]|nr:radical SAM protein [Candidatus Hydrogenedentota bacterium]
MKVLLINAPFDIPKMFGFKSRTKRLVYQQLGIGYIATGLEKAGHTVTFIDCQALQLNIEEAIVRLHQEAPDLVGIPCFIAGRFIAFELIKSIRTACPNLPVVLGGPQLTSFPEQSFNECPELELAILGEADFSLAELASKIESSNSLDDIPGLIRRDISGKLVYGPPQEIVQDLDTIPFPSRHIYQRELYNPMPFMMSQPNMPTERVITSRGCPWAKCRFCYQSNTKASYYRRRSPENVIAELRLLTEEHAAEFVFFTDDNFFQDEIWVKHFCDLFDLAGYSFKWNAFGRVNTVTQTMLQRASRSGCVHISYGFESGNQETLNLLRKGSTLQQNRQAAQWARDAGIEVAGFMMFGVPRETPEMAEQTIRFAIELNVDYMMFAPYHVFGGTPLAEIALQEGQLMEHDNVKFMLPTYVPNTYESAEQLNKMVRKAYFRFYFRPRYVIRALWRARKPGIFVNYVNKLWIGLQIILFKP